MAFISIIIPTYNRASIIPRTLDSIVAQTFKDWECLVVDDHSTDYTKDVIKTYSEKDSRIKYLVNTRKKGAQGARNTGLYASASPWISFFDSDNALYPEFLQSMVDGMDGESDVYKCFSHVVDSETGETICVEDGVAEGDIHRALFDGKVYVDFNHIIIRKSKVLEIGGLDEDCPSLQEFDTNIRLSRIAKYHTIQKALIYYYAGGKDTISCNVKKQVRGKYYNLKKFKSEWLVDKRNADRIIYELIQKMKRDDSIMFRLKYTLKIMLASPEMVPYYADRIRKRKQNRQK